MAHAPPATTASCGGEGVWDGMMDAISAAHDGNIQMIDSTSVRAQAGRDGSLLQVPIGAWPLCVCNLCCSSWGMIVCEELRSAMQRGVLRRSRRFKFMWLATVQIADPLFHALQWDSFRGGLLKISLHCSGACQCAL
jgi:hypothetical protein